MISGGCFGKVLAEVGKQRVWIAGALVCANPICSGVGGVHLLPAILGFSLPSLLQTNLQVLME